MKHASWVKRTGIGVAAACVLCILAFLLAPQPIVRALAAGVLHAAGYTLAYRDLHIGNGAMSARDLRITTNAGEPVAQIAAMRIAYSIPDALSGKRAYGLESVDLDTPQFTLIRHRDGTWNVPIPKQSNTQASASFDLSGAVRNGSVDIFDQAQGVVAARHLEIRNINAGAAICSQCRTDYWAQFAYIEQGRAYPVNGSGDIDPANGMALQHWQAAALPIAHITDVALNSPSFHISNGVLRSLDATIVGFFNRNGALDNHVDVTAQFTGGKLAIGGLNKPLRDVAGPIAVYGDGLLFPSLRATIAGAPLRVSGGIYDMRNPSLRLNVSGNGDLEALRTLVAQTSRVPIAGHLAVNVSIEGHPSQPLMLIAAQSPSVQVAQATLHGLDTRIAFDGKEADVLDARAGYTYGIGLDVRGKVATRSGSHALELIGRATGEGAQGTILATSDTLTAIDAQGSLSGALPEGRIRGVFSVNGRGVGTVGPLTVTSERGGTLYALAQLDRQHQTMDARVQAAHFPLPETRMPVALDGDVTATYGRGVLHIGGVAATGAAYADLSGTVARVMSGAPRYALSGHVDAAEIAPLVALVNPSAASLVEGRAQVTARITGRGTPAIHGTIASQEGAVNGLPFHGLNADFGATSNSVALTGGRVAVGSTNATFAADITQLAQDMSVEAPRADLQDFNDFFDAGDVLAGTGSIAASAALAPGSLATSGSLALHNARLRDVSLGAVNARWLTQGDDIDGTLAVSGVNGTLRGSGGVSATGVLHNVQLHARNLAVGRLLASAGYAEPVSGRVSANARLNGPWMTPHGTLAMSAYNATVAGIPIDAITGGGTFGLAAHDPLDLSFEARAARVAYDGATAAVQTQLRVRGTRARPQAEGQVVATNVTYQKVTIPRISALVRADAQTVALEQGEVDLQRGRIVASGTLPILHPALALRVTADDLELSNAAPLVPSPASLGGRIDGTVAITGTLRAPRANGQLSLTNGTYSGPQETVPIQGAQALLAFAGNTIALRNVHATIGGGTLDASGQATLPDLLHPARATMAAQLHANKIRIDAPQYVKGTFTGDLALARAAGSEPMLSGTIATDSARMPISALYNPNAPSGPAPQLPNIGLNLHVTAGRDVRVQSPNVDVGATGELAIAGTLNAPSLNGSFQSTGGTVSFGRTFNIESARVKFDPSSGIIPYVHAVATTYIANPATDIALDVAGPATNMNITFDSSPEYSRDQIVSMLALGGAAPAAGFSATGEATSLAEGQLNELFTRNLLEPFSVALGGALGFRNLQITSDVQSGLGIQGVKALGKVANVVFSDTFGEPRRQSISLQAHPSRSTRVDLTAYSTQNPTLFASGPVILGPNAVGNASTIPVGAGTNGVSFDVSRTFP